jgi:predicted nucleotidyltransferase
MHFLDNGIITTLCYADIFDFPLKESEIYELLIFSKKASIQTIQKRLSYLLQNGLIQQTNNYYHLPNRSSIVKKRLTHLQNSRRKMTIATTIAKKLAKVPFVRAVFLTGAVAVDNATRQDDIDILIISAPNSLWTCRFFAILLLEILRARRRPYAKRTAGKICLNLMLSSNSLSILPHLRNLYTAHEVIQVKPLYDPDDYWSAFQKDNAWIHDYLPNYVMPDISPKIHNHDRQASKILEIILRQLQRIYMWPKLTREIISARSAYFHPRDTGHIVLAKLSKNLKQYI